MYAMVIADVKIIVFAQISHITVNHKKHCYDWIALSQYQSFIYSPSLGREGGGREGRGAEIKWVVNP